jgi:hypothetical protein
MATDVTRTSYDPGRRYTGVVAQQGRVSLDAETNEQGAIAAGERVRDLLDTVGAAGTPDDGYAVAAGGGYDLLIGAGTMYVGGVRVRLDRPLRYGAQPDWRDAVGDPRFTPVPSTAPGGRELVVLELAEYEVTATEDKALREPALGGPDGAARLRTVQRVRRVDTDTSGCAGALRSAQQQWAAEGLAFDPATMRLESTARLLVEPDAPDTEPDPCEPGSATGFLGADNQTIRVQVDGVDPETGQFDLLWGYDNASFLYRVTPGTAGGRELTLDRSPVDTHHQPRAGQAVQVLRAAAELAAADGEVEGWAAARTGVSAVLGAPYDPDTRTVVLPGPLPARCLDQAATPQLYLRVWEGRLDGVAQGEAVPLPGTGLRVRLTADGGGPLHPGDHWSFAVRPATPDTVLPARLLRTAQPPDGPRLWAAPLAVIGWPFGSFRVLDDCRRRFVPLTGIEPCTTPQPEPTGDQGCCTAVATPDDAAGSGLQDIVDRAVQEHRDDEGATRVTVCLRPGRYELDQPLVLTGRHDRLHLEGCGEGAVLAVRGEPDDGRFAQGLITVVGTKGLRISGIDFRLPRVPPAGEGPDVLLDSVRSVGLRVAGCSGLEITACSFGFPELPEHRMFGAGVFAGGDCRDLQVTGCRFERQLRRGQPAGTGVPPRSSQLLAGLLVTTVPDEDPQAPVSRLFDTLLRDNVFRGLSVAVAASVLRGGDQRIEDNRVRGCFGGVWLLPPPRASTLDEMAEQLQEVAAELGIEVRGQLFAGGPDTLPGDLLAAARAYPAPDLFTDPEPPAPPWLEPSAVLRDNRVDCAACEDEEEQICGPAVVVWGQPPQQTEDDVGVQMLTLYGNELTARWNGPVAGVLEVPVSTVTGNMVANRFADGEGAFANSLTVLSRDDRMAVTGNVLTGRPALPDRQLASPFDTWLPLNTVIL